MKDIYKICPEFEKEQYWIRLLSEKDAADLLDVYSNKKVVSVSCSILSNNTLLFLPLPSALIHIPS